MSRRRRIYEGKAKTLFEGPEPGTIIALTVGATFFPFNLLPRATRATLPPTEAIEPPSAANCFSSVVRRSERAFSTCLRKVMSEAKSIRDRLILATAMLQ